MSDLGTYTTARACGYRVRVPAPDARCRWQPVTRSRTRGTTIDVLTAVGPMPTMFQHAARGQGANPAATVKRHRLRPSECLM